MSTENTMHKSIINQYFINIKWSVNGNIKCYSIVNDSSIQVPLALYMAKVTTEW